MGQECGKPAWPKPSTGYQTSTGCRYGRRHAYIGFRPTLEKPENPTMEKGCQWKEMEMDYIQEKNGLSADGLVNSTLKENSSANMVLPEKNGAKIYEDPHEKNLRCPNFSASTARSCRLKREQKLVHTSENRAKLKKSSEACAWPALEGNEPPLNNTNGFGIVNIDSYEPDSSDGEEEILSATSESHPVLQKQLDNMINELEKEFDYLSGLQSYIYSKTREEVEAASKNYCSEVCLKDCCQNSDKVYGEIPSDSEDKLVKTDQHMSGDIIGNAPSGNGCSLPKLFDCKGLQDSGAPEMVVRPKVRKQNNSDLEQKKLELSRDNQQSNNHQKYTAVGSDQCSQSPHTKTREMEKESFSEPSNSEQEKRRPKDYRSKNEVTNLCQHIIEGEQEDDDDDDDDFWEDLDDFSKKCGASRTGNDSHMGHHHSSLSSEISEGEWSASWSSDSAADKEHSSIDESWETLPGLDEPEHNVQSDNISLDDVPDINSHSEEPALLEEGEIPWLTYREETDSSSDEDVGGMSQFVHPGLFMLDGNNNFEDDSSMSEDFDAEWRALDDFGEGFGVAQAISHMDPQLLTYMALEERLAQAMEAALAHLESLAIDVEQAHPPATEEIINCLPNVTVLEDRHGQEQCCAICCCEYIKDEIATELPCHHIFHMSCVTLWLEKSGTCPVCRHVLTPSHPDAGVATSFVSDHESPPSTHSAAGTR
ncbi:E3 ubiquitin-protein ligase Praja-2 isoform X1 [Polypterus senegalus]|uniref:E3 ubiquitin-protein ligase Praja-2 isoform X1 n=1 Tax=Polypterus senegalus TaxID=55291 RepID=UPI001966208D|nr:E3 ubiquitin-protein ligase Praja-2 isoform X1 [Polypterus senegalus]